MLIIQKKKQWKILKLYFIEQLYKFQFRNLYRGVAVFLSTHIRQYEGNENF